MTGLSVDYAGLVRSLEAPLVHADLGCALLDAVAERYQRRWSTCSLVPNIFRQHRALNRGWSEQGKRFRALEREAALPDVFYYGHLLYEDDSAYPAELESGLLRDTELHVERFRNRFPPS